MLKMKVAGLRHPLALLGIAVTTTAAILICTLFAFELLGFVGNPYIGILTFVVMPMIFVAGLLMIPVGILLWTRRASRAAAKGQRPPAFPVIDFNRLQTRKIAFIVLLLTIVNVVILSSATYKGVETMDSVEFCGSCHTVMQPEATAYERSPHARVGCVECHIGPGAGWFVKSKLSGTRQLFATALETYPKPIPTPIHNLRPARDTCEQCHWPSQFIGEKLKVLTNYADDEENTETKTVLLLRVGGIQGRKAHGIHWHVDPRNQIRYRSDESRETIYDVEQTLPDGSVRVFSSGDMPEDAEPWRVMDCVDCHNRPTHHYRMPEREVSDALAAGRIDPELPFIVREALSALETEYDSHDAARAGIRAAIDSFYRDEYPDVYGEKRDAVEAAGEVVGEIFTINVFPQMNVTWGTYPDHIGHEVSDGCFRCHNDMHETPQGDVISQDCTTCHSVLAWDEEDPEILTMLDQ